jgi:hypothetical protein
MNEYKYILLWLKYGDVSLAFWCHSCELCKIGCERCDSSTSPSLQLNNAKRNKANPNFWMMSSTTKWKRNRWNVIRISSGEISLGLMVRWERRQAHTCITLEKLLFRSPCLLPDLQKSQNTPHIRSEYFRLYNLKCIYRLI